MISSRTRWLSEMCIKRPIGIPLVPETSRPFAKDTSGDLLKEIVSTTLKDVLGESPAEALIFHLGESSTLHDPRDFSKNLERVIGPGAVVIEKLIVKSLYERAGARADDNGLFDFEGSAKKAKNLLSKRGVAP